ncbi:uncharacterized protein [Apostichopus japonicus]|uniref:uncharacterized protein n=1 Tax=Stichopus japonicus TaxID=307972 RepID=UPI003AB8ED0F
MSDEIRNQLRGLTKRGLKNAEISYYLEVWERKVKSDLLNDISVATKRKRDNSNLIVSDTDDEDSSSAENEILTEPDSSSKSRRPSKKPPESLTGAHTS